ncbi:Germacrene C/D synthase [Rhizoctonia solani]|uniref:Germacrene C/D synthase n=1 Tax=Rhizoctonia solani TaxID=456999 RepID=A0A0K6FZ85_9AGAM|nr:Germacrene C/D synthase [Rhizoctonia solani]
MYNIPAAPEVTLNALIDGVLATFPPDSLDPVCDTLAFNNIIQDPHNNPKWKWLPQDPNAAQSDNLNAFSFFEEIVLAVVNSQSPSKRFESDLKFRVTRKGITIGSGHDSSYPDGFFYLRKRQRRPTKFSRSDLFMPMVFNTTENERDKINDHSKMIECMHLIMQSDPRRRFVHGLTCENTRMRLCMLVRRLTNIHEWKYLVRIITSMLLAPPDRLGLDPDVELVPCDDLDAEPSYDTTIRNSDTEEYTTYRTLKTISNAGASRMVGPGTRVWLVQKLVDGNLAGPRYILKDAWIREDCVPEHVALKEIQAAQPSYARHFLTLIDHGLAYFSVAAPDHTHTTMRRLKLIPTNKVLLIRSNTTRGHEDYWYHWCLSELSRRHYRIVLEEIGTPVYNLSNWTDVFIAVQGAWEGLHAMHLCGYVHRDVSVGNILLVPASGSLTQRGVIIDLEYAKKTNDMNSPYDRRTGTADFMATEVEFAEHHRLEELRQARINAHPDRVSTTWYENQVKPLPQFRHNPLHDMESIWWVCSWMMFHLIPPGQSNEVHSDNYHRIFDDRYSKRDFITYSLKFSQWTAHLPGAAPFVSIMREWAIFFKNHYRSCYRRQDTSKTLLKHIRVGIYAIKSSYEDGKTFLQQLEEASRSPPATLLSAPQQGGDDSTAVTIN